MSMFRAFAHAFSDSLRNAVGAALVDLEPATRATIHTITSYLPKRKKREPRMNTTRQDRIDIARDEFRDAIEAYNKKVLTYNAAINAAYGELATGFFNEFEPAVLQFAKRVRDLSSSGSAQQSFADGLTRFSDESFPSERQFVKTVDADVVICEFDNLPDENADQ